MAKAVVSKGRVHAFEPQKRIFRELTCNLGPNKVQNPIPLRFALGSQTAVVEMNPPPVDNEGGVSIGGGDQAELRAIDGFGFKNVSLVKREVGSYEDRLLEGTSCTIAAQHPVLVIERCGSMAADQTDLAAREHYAKTSQKLQGFGYEAMDLADADFLAIFPKQ
jgi:FkbM family methyltransferase